jgi:hypothetical protein
MILTGENRRTWRETYPSATLSTTNPTWTALGANPGFCGENPATFTSNSAMCGYSYSPSSSVSCLRELILAGLHSDSIY